MADRIVWNVGTFTVNIIPLHKNNGGGYECLCEQLNRSCVGYGKTRAEALVDFESALKVVAEAIAEDGQYIEPDYKIVV